MAGKNKIKNINLLHLFLFTCKCTMSCQKTCLPHDTVQLMCWKQMFLCVSSLTKNHVWETIVFWIWVAKRKLHTHSSHMQSYEKKAQRPWQKNTILKVHMNSHSDHTILVPVLLLLPNGLSQLKQGRPTIKEMSNKKPTSWWQVLPSFKAGNVEQNNLEPHTKLFEKDNSTHTARNGTTSVQGTAQHTRVRRPRRRHGDVTSRVNVSRRQRQQQKPLTDLSAAFTRSVKRPG